MADKVDKFIRRYDLGDEMEDFAHENSVDDIESAIRSAKSDKDARTLIIYHMNALIQTASSVIKKLTEEDAERIMDGENAEEDEEDEDEEDE